VGDQTEFKTLASGCSDDSHRWYS